MSIEQIAEGYNLDSDAARITILNVHTVALDRLLSELRKYGYTPVETFNGWSWNIRVRFI